MKQESGLRSAADRSEITLSPFETAGMTLTVVGGRYRNFGIGQLLSGSKVPSFPTKKVDDSAHSCSGGEPKRLMIRDGIEPSTYGTLDRCDNPYATEPRFASGRCYL